MYDEQKSVCKCNLMLKNKYILQCTVVFSTQKIFIWIKHYIISQMPDSWCHTVNAILLCAQDVHALCDLHSFKCRAGKRWTDGLDDILICPNEKDLDVLRQCLMYR